MSLFKEIPPTAGFPVYLSGLLSPLKERGHQHSLEKDVRDYLNIAFVRVTCSGTAGLYLICEGLKNISSKRTIIIPAYICPSVPLAIARAGLKVEVCDIQRDNFNFNLNDLEILCSKNKDIVGVLAAHLGGIPVDFNALVDIVKPYGIYIIEDCAQSLGAVYNGKKVGTLGDFSFFSLARGKGLTIYEGGIIATGKKEFTLILETSIRKLERSNFFSESLKVIELLGYSIFYRPQLFWFAYKLPEIFWQIKGDIFKRNAEYFSANFPIHRVSKIRKAIGHAYFYLLDEALKQQREKASLYIERLKDIKEVKIMREGKDSKATYPFLTLILDKPESKKKALRVLGGFGLGVSELYTLPITGYSYLEHIVPKKNLPAASYLAERQITLSTNTFLNNQDLYSITDTFKKLQQNGHHIF